MDLISFYCFIVVKLTLQVLYYEIINDKVCAINVGFKLL